MGVAARIFLVRSVGGAVLVEEQLCVLLAGKKARSDGIDPDAHFDVNTKKQVKFKKIQPAWWLRGPDLNQRPSGYEPDELPDCSTPRYLLFLLFSGSR